MVTGNAFVSLVEAPLDPYLVPDQGDVGGPPPMLTAEHRRFAKTSPAIPVIPFTRTLEVGSVGRDVVGAKRAIWKATGLKIPTRATESFGPTAVKQLKAFQAAHHLTPDGVLGPATLRQLGPFFDRLAFFDYVGYPPGGNPAERMRRAVVAYAVWGYNHRGEIGYAEFRPMAHLNELEHLPETEDCSTFATKAYKFAGAPDPNGLGYSGAGNTTTEREHGHVVPLSAAQPGDLAQYQGPDHVAVYVGGGRVISHGSAIGPLLLPVGYRPLHEIRAYL